MLVLSRKESERLKLGDDIIITVVKVSGDKVRLGIEAPPHILVLRDELEPISQDDELTKEDAVIQEVDESTNLCLTKIAS